MNKENNEREAREFISFIHSFDFYRNTTIENLSIHDLLFFAKHFEKDRKRRNKKVRK